MTTKDVNAIWGNKLIPVVHRPSGKNSIRIRIPYAEDNRSYLGGGTRKQEPVWDKEMKFWSLPRSRFNEVVDLILKRHENIYIIQPYLETEKCAPACRKATGHECQCSCLGANHGSGNDGSWFDISESLALRHGKQTLGCRLLTVK